MYMHTQSYHFFFNKLNTHTVKSMKTHQLSSKQGVAAQSHRCGGEDVICDRSESDLRGEEAGSEKCCPSFNSATIPKQRPHQFILITPRCCMGSTYRQFIYHESQLTFYVMQPCSASTQSMLCLHQIMIVLIYSSHLQCLCRVRFTPNVKECRK